jgi:hypothetical protein
VEQLEAAIAALRTESSLFATEVKLALAEIKGDVKQVNGHVADVLAEVGTVPDHRYREPDRMTVTKRLHALENDQAAAKAAHAALVAAEQAREQAIAAMNQSRKQAEEASNHRWSALQKIGVFAISISATVIALLGLLGVGGH